MNFQPGDRIEVRIIRDYHGMDLNLRLNWRSGTFVGYDSDNHRVAVVIIDDHQRAFPHTETSEIEHIQPLCILDEMARDS